jgi:hypothetical protein
MFLAREKNRRTNRMGTDWLGVDSEERYSSEGTVISQTEYCIPQLEGSMMLISIALMEINVYRKAVH